MILKEHLSISNLNIIATKNYDYEGETNANNGTFELFFWLYENMNLEVLL